MVIEHWNYRMLLHIPVLRCLQSEFHYPLFVPVVMHSCHLSADGEARVLKGANVCSR